MKPRSLLNLLLLLITLVLISISIQILDHKQSSKINLLDINRNNIQQITIPRNQSSIVLAKYNNNWQMIKPYNVRAHSFRVNKLLDLLDADISNTYKIKPEKLKSFGLDKPRATIFFNDQPVHFGKTNPVSNKRYIQTKKFITLIDDQIYPLISSQPSSFVDLKILDNQLRITGLHLPDLILTQQPDGNWLSSDKQKNGSDQIQILLEHWQQAQAFAVHAYLERKQLGTVLIELNTNKTLEFEISDTSPWLILGQKDFGIEYHFDSEVYTRLFSFEKPESTQ